MLNTWFWRVVRLVVVLFIILCIADAAGKHPVGTPVTLGVVFLVFMVFEWPYKLILQIFLHVSKADIVWNVHPFKKKILSYQRKNNTKGMSQEAQRHENRHLWQVHKWTPVGFVLLYLLGLIWFAYVDHPFEIDARAAEKG